MLLNIVQAIVMAMKNKMDVALEIAIGSSLQIILFVSSSINIYKFIIYSYEYCI